MLPRILTWDIETSTSNFKANSGFLVCVGFKALGKPVEILQRNNMLPDPLNDRTLVQQVYQKLISADMWITHNGKWFDIPYMQSRLLKWGLAPLPAIPNFDTCELGFKRLKIKNSLEAMGEYFGCKIKKYKVSMDTWIRAYVGNKAAMAEIVRHCEADVKLTEQVYLSLRPLGIVVPNLYQFKDFSKGCPKCGATGRMESRGFGYATKRAYRKFQCQACLGWTRGSYV